MLLIFFRTAVIFLVLFAIMRIMGKRQIGELQPYEFVVALLIADLACIPMADNTIPLSYGIAAILTIFVMHQLLNILAKKSGLFGRIISSKPSIVINREGIDFEEIKKLNIGVNELQENLRIAGISNFDEVEYALIETNGKFSILKKPDTEPLPERTPLSVCFIEGGKLKSWEAHSMANEKDVVLAALKDAGISDIKDVLVATLDNNGKLYYQVKGESYKTTTLTLKEDVW